MTATGAGLRAILTALKDAGNASSLEVRGDDLLVNMLTKLRDNSPHRRLHAPASSGTG
jgi:hypothetical protein